MIEVKLCPARRHVMLLCPIIGDVNFDHLVNVNLKHVQGKKRKEKKYAKNMTNKI